MPRCPGQAAGTPEIATRLIARFFDMTMPTTPSLLSFLSLAPATRRALLRPLADTSAHAIVAGFVAMMTGYGSSLVLIFQAGRAAHLSDAQISSWIWALSIGMAVATIGLSLRFKAPIVVALSTPGAALLVTSLPLCPMPRRSAHSSFARRS